MDEGEAAVRSGEGDDDHAHDRHDQEGDQEERDAGSTTTCVGLAPKRAVSDRGGGDIVVREDTGR